MVTEVKNKKRLEIGNNTEKEVFYIVKKKKKGQVLYVHRRKFNHRVDCVLSVKETAEGRKEGM